MSANNRRENQKTASSDGNSSLDNDIRNAIRLMVANISKSFIVEWYTKISPSNHDFVASCETLIETVLEKLAELCAKKLDKYKIGQLVTSLLHDHILNDNSIEKIQSIENQIDNHEYDICQNSVVRLFGILSTEELRRVIFTTYPNIRNSSHSNSNSNNNNNNNISSNNYNHASQSSSSSSASSGHKFDDSSLLHRSETKQTTSALYTLVIAMLTKAVFMQIVNSISDPKWLYAVIIWLCNKEREKMKLEKQRARGEEEMNSDSGDNENNNSNSNNNRNQFNSVSSKLNDILMSPPIVITNTRGFRSLDLEEGIDIATGNINFESPVCDSLKRPLDNIEIYGTEEVKSHNSCYVLYCISYDGLCHRHPSASGPFSFIPEAGDESIPIIDKRATAMTHRRLQSTSSTSNSTTLKGGGAATDASNLKSATTSLTTKQGASSNDRNTFRRRMTIKRRFREFVLLQLRLEENPKIRPYMKNIPKPTKLKAATQNIFSLPGINNIKLDQSTIKLRQRFLERFLIALNSSPFIANSYELKEFFSYNVQTTYNITKSRSSILQVNLNKVFVDSVRSALSIIRSTLPGDAGCNLSSNSQPDPDAWLTELQQSTMKLHIQTRTSHSKMNLERLIDSKLLSINSDSPIRQQQQQKHHNRTLSLGRNMVIKNLNPTSRFDTSEDDCYYYNYNYNTYSNHPSASSYHNYNYNGTGYHSKANSLRVAQNHQLQQQQQNQHLTSTIHKSNSANSNIYKSTTIASSSSTTTFQSKSSSASSSRKCISSNASSIESIYHDASNVSPDEDPAANNSVESADPKQTVASNPMCTIRMCDSVPIATKFIDIIHYSISKNSQCCNSSINFIAKFLLGKTIERQAIRLLEAAFTLKIATFCINGITSSIWDESNDPPLDLENANLDEAVLHLTNLLEANYANYRFIPKQFLSSLIGNQLKFYLSQLASQKRNKFVIYSFFVHLLDELESTSD